jgi:hypothetical protein
MHGDDRVAHGPAGRVPHADGQVPGAGGGGEKETDKKDEQGSHI